MRLSRIKLAGFKSFVDPTTIAFPSNLVGVVGPNGCGKSNVIDAIRWVMGETSAKHLRGDFAAHPITRVAPSVPEADVRPSGNASFDAYRSEMLDRLEKEQSRFDDFLGRLREAKDKAEFEDFMEDRARAARAATGTDDAPELREPA